MANAHSTLLTRDLLEKDTLRAHPGRGDPHAYLVPGHALVLQRVALRNNYFEGID